MSKRLIRNYTFDKTAGTVTFTAFSGTVAELRQDRILLIADATRGTIIYNPFDPAKLGTVGTGASDKNVLTLAFNVSAYANTDALLIFYDFPGARQASYVFGTGTNLTQVLARPGTLRSVVAFNQAPKAAFVKCFDVASSGSVTLGTTVANFQIPVPANTGLAGVVLPIPEEGIELRNGLSIATMDLIALNANDGLDVADMLGLTLVYV